MYRSKKGRTYELPYPYVRYCQFSEFDIVGMYNLLNDAHKKVTKDSVLGSFGEDMIYLAFVFAREGSSLSKIMAKRLKGTATNKNRADQLAKLENLIHYYGIIAKPNNSIEPTIYRIGTLYCREVSTFFHERKIKPFLDAVQLGSIPEPLEGFPLAMSHCAFAPLIPSPYIDSQSSVINTTENSFNPHTDTIFRIEDEGATRDEGQTTYIFPENFRSNSPLVADSNKVEITNPVHPTFDSLGLKLKKVANVPRINEAQTKCFQLKEVIDKLEPLLGDTSLTNKPKDDNCDIMELISGLDSIDECSKRVHDAPANNTSSQKADTQEHIPNLLLNGQKNQTSSQDEKTMNENRESRYWISPEDFECLYYGYAHHQKVFYERLTGTGSKTGPRSRRTLKKPREILNYIDEQIAYPLFTESQKFEFLEKVGILVKCQDSENITPNPARIVYKLESSVKSVLKKAADAWKTHNNYSGDRVINQVMNGFGLAF